jgi:UDP-N-acetyl-D-mannosaminuronic acid dehydrogenase
VKLIQNTHRDTNIALANEISKLAHDYGIDSREAIDLANEHPRVKLLQPGPGVGGHCLPIDPWFLGQNSDELDLIKTARQVNDGMSQYVIEILEEELGTLAGKKIAILGVAYKGDVGDTRKSPGLKLARELQAVAGQDSTAVAADGGAGVNVALHDPHVIDQTLQLESLDDALADADGIVIATDHDEYESLDPTQLQANESVVVDTRAMIDDAEWRKNGFTVVTI